MIPQDRMVHLFQEIVVVSCFLKNPQILLIIKSLNYPLQANAQLLFHVCDAKI